MKKLIFLAIATVCFISAEAQNGSSQPVKDVEGEVSLGFNAAGQNIADKNIVGLNLGLEMRANFERPFDLGVRFDQSFNYADAGICEVRTRSTTLQLVGDWNFRRGSNVAPFIGLGIGYLGGSIDCDYPLESTVSDDTFNNVRTFVVTPRVGIEFFNRMRLTASYAISHSDYCNFRLSLGICIGGGRKNK